MTGADVAAALGGRDTAVALRAAGDALPSLRRWALRLTEIDDDGARDLLVRADHALDHRFDLLGSGPTELGPVIDWHRDFKTGRRWPLVHISQVPVSFPDASDIKVPWELSRCQHLPLLAGAFLISSDRRYFDEIGDQLTHWISSNPVEFGANWACTMDVAIRGTNWLAALALCADDVASASWGPEVLGSLLVHGRFIRTHLESGVARGNHYLSDIVGLLVIAGLFGTSAEGRAWIGWSVQELAREMSHQVRSDGCDHEASISYHRLVTELFVIGADAADALAPGALEPCVRQGIDRMLEFVADYTRPDGLAPQIGDVDDGRLLPLGDYASADQRSHRHLFTQAGRPYRPATASGAYPDGGFYILRAGDLYAAVRCGDVGIYGRGCHAHNDLMAFEFACGETPIVVDPGTYLYTADPAARNHFRSTGVHSALQVDGAEQNELRLDRLFAMVDRARPEVVRWELGDPATILQGRHRGFEHLAGPVTYTRMLRLSGPEASLVITDEITSDSSHELSLALPLAPCEARIESDQVIAIFPESMLRVSADGLVPRIEQGWLSPSYGVRIQAPVIRLSGRSDPGTHHVIVRLSVV